MANLSFQLLSPGLPYKTGSGGIGYCSITLIRDGSDTILFDVGQYALRAKVQKYIEKYKINTVFLSHLHYDHCLNIDLFLNRGIKIYLNKKEWNYLRKAGADDIYTFRFFNKIVKRKDIILFENDMMISNQVKAIETIGHTEGHSSLAFEINGIKHIIAGDAIKTFNEYLDQGKPDTAPYNLKKFISNRKYIIDNFDVIIPGHDNVIIRGDNQIRYDEDFRKF